MSGPGRRAITVAVAFLASLGGSALFAVAYLTGRSTQLLAAGMALALGALGVGLVVWSKALMPQGPWQEQREASLASERGEQEAADAFEEGKREVGRRRLLGGLLASAAGLLGLAALLPVRSLGPAPQPRTETGWAAGVRLVDEQGQPIGVGDLAVGGVLPAFPEGVERRAEAQIMLVRLEEAALRAPPDRQDWAVEGNVAYSRVCTHAGCPVGLFQPDAQLLLCPCHQAAFSVPEAGRTVFGPAPRALPQLPLDADADGMLVARSDFPDPVGPGRWRRG